MKLISMKNTSKDTKTATAEVAKDTPQYAYGTRLELGKTEIEKLGLSDADVGDYYFITAKAKVVNTSESQYEGSDEHKNITMQITSLALKPIVDADETDEKPSKEDISAKLMKYTKNLMERQE